MRVVHRLVAVMVGLCALAAHLALAGTPARPVVREFFAGTGFWIAKGPGNSLYFDSGTRVGRVTKSGRISLSRFAASGRVQGLAAGPGGVWFTSSDGGVFQLTKGGNGKRVAKLASDSHPVGIARGRDGAMWVAQASSDQIARVTKSGAVKQYALTEQSDPYSIVAGPDGALWFTELTGDRIGRLSTSGELTEYDLQPGTLPRHITVGPDRALWFTQSGMPRIGRITTDGTIKHFGGLRAPAVGITSGPDGALWFVESNGNRYGRLTIKGRLREHKWKASTDRAPQSIISGPDGALWFREFLGPGLARISKLGR